MYHSDFAYYFYCLQAARETGALQAAKNKLEKQVEELTWRLQLEKRMRVSMIVKLAETNSFIIIIIFLSFILCVCVFVCIAGSRMLSILLR